jgi:hypothetical protein
MIGSAGAATHDGGDTRLFEKSKLIYERKAHEDSALQVEAWSASRHIFLACMVR